VDKINFKKKKILHVVPTAYGGGVESAAKSFLKYSCDKFKFKVFFLENNKQENSFKAYLLSSLKIFTFHPDIILTSLWKSNFITLIYKFLNLNNKYILFLHDTHNKHFVDKFITSLSALFAYEIWADSNATLEQRLKSLYFQNNNKFSFFKTYKNKRVISLVKEKIRPLNEKRCNHSFIYWGRLDQKKNINKALKLFAKIYKLEKKSTFTIIGPDYGEKNSLTSLIDKLGLKDNVFIYDQMSFDEIKKYANLSSFFIQLSSYEGLAMSVSESMQLGLVPIVTAVGQIKSYCRNLENSLIYQNNDNDLIRNISLLISSPKKYSQMRKNAIDTWKNTKTYKNDIISALNFISN